MAELHLYDVIRRPVVTEKSSVQSDELHQYVFEVAPEANKIQIKEAIEVIFEVDVLKVNTMVMPAKRGHRRQGLHPLDIRPRWRPRPRRRQDRERQRGDLRSLAAARTSGGDPRRAGAFCRSAARHDRRRPCGGHVLSPDHHARSFC